MVVSNKAGLLEMYHDFGKRILDLILVIPALVLLSPLMALIGLLVCLSLGSPILFQQKRPGLGGRPFTIYKFRTMANAYDAQGEPLPDAQRLTMFGKFLRSTSLDELPELFNVLKGEMSLVGPRPLMWNYLDLYTPEQRRRHDARPGITGWAQIHGRNNVSWDERLAMDVWYADHQSLSLDIEILVKTAYRVANREGISQAGYATASDFAGSQQYQEPTTIADR
jgi:sugar transferase EpsL